MGDLPPAYCGYQPIDGLSSLCHHICVGVLCEGVAKRQSGCAYVTVCRLTKLYLVLYNCVRVSFEAVLSTLALRCVLCSVHMGLCSVHQGLFTV